MNHLKGPEDIDGCFREIQHLNCILEAPSRVIVCIGSVADMLSDLTFINTGTG